MASNDKPVMRYRADCTPEEYEQAERDYDSDLEAHQNRYSNPGWHLVEYRKMMERREQHRATCTPHKATTEADHD